MNKYAQIIIIRCFERSSIRKLTCELSFWSIILAQPFKSMGSGKSSRANVFNIDNKKRCFLSIKFLEDHMTLKTGAGLNKFR